MEEEKEISASKIGLKNYSAAHIRDRSDCGIGLKKLVLVDL